MWSEKSLQNIIMNTWNVQRILPFKIKKDHYRLLRCLIITSMLDIGKTNQIIFRTLLKKIFKKYKKFQNKNSLKKIEKIIIRILTCNRLILLDAVWKIM